MDVFVLVFHSFLSIIKIQKPFARSSVLSLALALSLSIVLF